MHLPWGDGPLAGWDIVGMNHYRVGGQRHLFVAMTKDAICIRAEGLDELEVFKKLSVMASAVSSDLK